MLKQKLTGSGVDATYIEDVFSTYLFTGTGSATAINNGIDLSTKGGLVWIKDRNSGAMGHALFDTARGGAYKLQSQSTGAQSSYNNIVFGTTGFTNDTQSDNNNSGTLYTSWTFRKQPKFFDVVTYTGDGVAGRRISHNLGSVPGCIIVKSTTYALGWPVYHRSLDQYTNTLYLDSTAAAGASKWNEELPTSTDFPVSSNDYVNKSGETYVAYIFAHDAGGFGLTGTDNVISCGSFTPDGSGNATIDLGWEPQWLLRKTYNNTGDWEIRDSMRDFSMSSSSLLYPNYSLAETTGAAATFIPTATGFKYVNGGTQPMIYIAIRRGPMKVPTDGTKVFNLANKPSSPYTVGFPTDMAFWKWADGSQSFYWKDRLRGTTASLTSATTSAEASTGTTSWDLQNQIADTNFVGTLYYMGYYLRRSPSFFDEVCYTGTGSAATISHNLGAVPEMMIVKNRGTTVAWKVYHSAIGNTNFLELNSTGASSASTTIWNDTTPTSSVFTVGSGAGVNQSGVAQVAYLFATCPGVSKVGSYTGNGSSQTINCGFTAGARFVMIKRTDSTGDWYVWDTARGIVSGNDPHLSLNTTSAEVTSDDTIDTDSTGFVVNQLSATNVNVSSATYIFLAIA